MSKVLAAVQRVSKSILPSTLLWVPGLGQAAESFPLPQATQKVGYQLGFENGVGGQWSEFVSKLPLSLQLSQAVAPLPPCFCKCAMGESVSQFAYHATPSLTFCAPFDARTFT